VVPFEISSVLFLSAMIGAIVIGKKDKVEKNIAG
jgi:NADH:ubiquinone oxidoreductase subunit 6 (subunit J)